MKTISLLNLRNDQYVLEINTLVQKLKANHQEINIMEWKNDKQLKRKRFSSEEETAFKEIYNLKCFYTKKDITRVLHN